GDRVGATYQSTDALWAAELVPGYRQKIGSERVDVAGDTPGRLHRVDVQQAARRVNDRRGRRDRLHRAGLIIGVHERDEHAPPFAVQAGELPLERGEVEDTVRPDRHLSHAVGGEAPTGEYRRMLDRGNQQHVGRVLRRERRRIRFRAARREYDIGGFGAD